MTTVYDKFMIDNPHDNHFDKMKLNGLFINWNEQLCPFITSTTVDLRFRLATSYMSIIHSSFDENMYFSIRDVSDKLRIYNYGNQVDLYMGYHFANNQHVDQCVMIYQKYDMIDRMMTDGCLK